MISRTTRRIFYTTLLIIGFAVLIIVHLRLRIYAQDDAYIHFRIVRNWVEQSVPYFNPSERVMATSSVGWTIVLYMMAQASRILHIADLPAWTAVWNGLIVGLGVLVYLGLLRRISSIPLQIMVTIFFVVTYISQMLKPSLGLMETPTAMFLAGLALLGLMSDKRGSLVLFGMLPFFRLELVVLTGLAVMYALFVKHWPLKILGYLILGAFPFLLFDGYYFGTVIPNTVRAKSIVYQLNYTGQLTQLAGNSLDDVFLLRLFYPFPEAHKRIYMFYALLIVAGWITIFNYREARKAFSKQWKLLDTIGLLFSLWCLTILGAYIVKKAFLFSWYEPLYIIPGLLLISWTLLGVRTKLLVWLLVPLLFAQMLGIAEAVLAVTVSPVYYLDLGVGARARQYQIVGNELYTCYPQARVMTSEIGGLGYGFRGYILDGVGLVTPEALRYHPLSVPDERNNGSIGAIPYQFIVEKNPEIIVAYDFFIKTFMLSHKAKEYFHYELPMLDVEDSKILGLTNFWDSKALNLYVRRDLVLSGQTCPALGVLP